jgi:hypothetical protein
MVSSDALDAHHNEKVEVLMGTEFSRELSAGPPLEWIIAQVHQIQPSGGGVGVRMTLIVTAAAGGTPKFYYNVPCLASYTPVVGQKVHAIRQEGKGMLVLGTTRM